MIHGMELTKEKVNKIRKDDSLVFLMFSDAHVESVDSESAYNLMNMLNAVSSSIKLDAVIDLGDNVSMLGRATHISNQELKDVFRKLFFGIRQSVDCPLYMVSGNHDAIGTDFFKPDYWNGIVKDDFVDKSAVYHSEGSYYYVDFDNCKTRMIFLSIPYDSELAAEYPTPLWKFGAEQIKWLAEIALDTSYDVLIVSHVPFYYNSRGDETKMTDTWDGKQLRKSRIIDLCGWVEDYNEVVAILESFRAKGRVIACFSGHTHEDSLWNPYERCGEETNPLLCPQIVIKSFSSLSSKQRKYDAAMDIVIWTPSDNRVSMVRCGDGEDREVCIKDFK